MTRENRWEQALNEHLENRDWTEHQIAEFGRLIVHNSFLSYETALTVLEYQQATDEINEAVENYDRVFQPTLWDSTDSSHKYMLE